MYLGTLLVAVEQVLLDYICSQTVTPLTEFLHNYARLDADTEKERFHEKSSLQKWNLDYTCI